ncbi:MAG: imidazole glycerol phosphate synthase subunit HisF [Elusimicrobia bacterium]|nr:imidazole glycerol phosphate synthase subunit HisF [Elusimicrobiota bacterium]
MSVRIIPRLDIKGPNLVKGIHLEGLRVLGKPEHFARYYYEAGADELIYMDVVASLYGRNTLLDMIRRTSKEIFIPLAVGGGLRSLEDIQEVLRAGADKVALNTAVLARPELIREASRRFGSSTIVVSIEAMKKPDGRYEAYADNGRQHTGMDVFQWALRAVELGAGEIMLTSINQEGTGQGFDFEMVGRVAESVPVPVIACGGAGRLSHVYDVLTQGKADAVCLASILHYEFIASQKYDLMRQDYSTEGNIDYLRSGRSFSRITPATLVQVKDFLSARGIACRPQAQEPAGV